MSRLYGSMQGNRGTVTRTGSTEIGAHVRTWDVGGAVDMIARRDGTFLITFYLTGGSNEPSTREAVAQYRVDAIGNVIES